MKMQEIFGNFSKKLATGSKDRKDKDKDTAAI